MSKATVTAAAKAGYELFQQFAAQEYQQTSARPIYCVPWDELDVAYKDQWREIALAVLVAASD